MSPLSRIKVCGIGTQSAAICSASIERSLPSVKSAGRSAPSCAAPCRHTDQDWDMDVVAVVGLGYVGLSLAVEFGTRRRTIGVDLSARKVASYRRGIDPGAEVSAEQFAAARWLELGCDAAALSEADYILVAVPTPVDHAHN